MIVMMNLFPIKEVIFVRDDLIKAAKELDMKLPKNLGEYRNMH